MVRASHFIGSSVSTFSRRRVYLEVVWPHFSVMSVGVLKTVPLVAVKARCWVREQGFIIRNRLEKMLKCIFIRKQFEVEDLADSSESLATRDYSASRYSSRAAEIDNHQVNASPSNIEEAESSLRESGFLNYEEARALLGRLEYQKGNVEAALRVFEGIDFDAMAQSMKVTLARKSEFCLRQSLSDDTPSMSMHAVTLLFEARFLKAKSLQGLKRFEEAGQTCQMILDIVESALPEGLPEKLTVDCKLQDTLNKAVELLPEMWKCSGAPGEAISSYRRALLYQWNLELETRARIEKEFAVFLLYSGTEADAPTLRFQIEGSFIPRNNIEEAILLLLILIRRLLQRRIRWDPSIMDHLSFVLSISGNLGPLASQVEELPPEMMDRKERIRTLSLSYSGEGEDLVALNLLRNLLHDRENVTCIEELLLAAKLCGESASFPEEGINYASEVISKLHGKCELMMSNASCLLGISLSALSRLISSEHRRTLLQSEALKELESAARLAKSGNSLVLYQIALENAEQRKLDTALHYAKQHLELEGGSTLKGWILLARVLSAKKLYVDAETVIDAAQEETGKWDHAELLRPKAKLHIAQGKMKSAVQTYIHLLAVLQVRKKSFGISKKLLKCRRDQDRLLEAETWLDLADLYANLSLWRDAEVCLSKSEAICPCSATRWHSKGLLHQAKGLKNEALASFWKALDIDPNHVPSLISISDILIQLGDQQSLAAAKCFLKEANRLDRTNSSAWYYLGLLYKSESGVSAVQAAECFEAAALLQETAPVEPFR